MCDQICVYNWDIREKVHLEEIVFPFSDKSDIYHRNIFFFYISIWEIRLKLIFLSDRTIPDNSIQASDCVEIQYLCYWEKKEIYVMHQINCYVYCSILIWRKSQSFRNFKFLHLLEFWCLSFCISLMTAWLIFFFKWKLHVIWLNLSELG